MRTRSRYRCVSKISARRDRSGDIPPPERLAAFLDDVDVDTEYLKLTLDVGHAKATDIDYERFVDRFGDRIRIAHLHDNDGHGDDHDPLPEFRSVAADVGTTYNVLEMKSLADIDRCLDDLPTRT